MKRNLLKSFLAIVGLAVGMMGYAAEVTETYDFGAAMTGASGNVDITLTDQAVEQEGEFNPSTVYVMENPVIDGTTLELNGRFAVNYVDNKSQTMRWLLRNSSSNTYQLGLGGNWVGKGTEVASYNLSILNLYAGDKVTVTYAIRSGKDAQPKAVKSGALKAGETTLDAGAALESGTTYEVVADGTDPVHVDLAVTNDNMAIQQIVIVAQEREAEEPKPEPDPINAVVKMTWVDYDNPDASNGEIAMGETARAGYNKISGGTVGFGNTGWGENKIAYLQVDASAAEGTITNVTLTAECSGSSDSKRVTNWGMGYNSSAWSADMTYNTADKSIIQIGQEASTTTKLADEFETLTFDITDAFIGNDSKIATIVVYETAPAGGYIKNPTVVVTSTNVATAQYTIKYVDGEGNEVREAVVRSGVIGNPIVLASTDTENFFTEGETPVKYIYVSNDAEGKTIEAGDATVVTVTFRQAATMHYTVSASIADQTIALVDSSYFEGETVYYNFPRYYAIDGALYQKPEGEKDPGFYRGSAVLTEDNQAITVTGYSLIDTVNVAYFSEAEDIEGLTLSSNTTAEVRMSMGKTAFNGGTEPVTIVTLPAGQYKIYTTTWGSAGQTFTFYAGDVDILMAECTGSSADASAEFTLMEETAITLAGDPSITNGGIDYVLIDKTGDVVVEQADATFDFNANAWGLPTSNNDDQDAGNLGDQTIEEEGVVLSFTDGGTATRLWTGSVTELRFYKNGGSVTVTAPVNKVITKIELDGDIDLTASEGTLDGTTWTGNATAVTFSANATNKINTIDVYLAAAPAVVVENIAALKALPAGTVARLTLNDTKISVKAATMMGTYTIIEDETGGILILPDQTGMVGDITTMFPEQFANDSVALNGYIYATVSDMNGLPALDICDSTSVSEFTATPCELTPKTIEIADATNQENGMRLVQFVKATVTATGLTQGDATIPIMDMLGVMMGELPETEIDITGFVLDLGADLGGAMFVPLSYSDKNYNAIDGVNADADSLDGDVYSINGVKVRNAGESLDGLKGLYIINGKKVVLD